MRKRILFGFLVLGLASIPSLYAQFDSGSTGEDGPFNPTPSTQMPIRCPEPDCVFNFTTVNIPTGVTVKFAPNRFNTPVTILAQGDVMIAGTIDITGSDGLGGSGGAGGPGGFRGGDGGRPGTAIADRMGGSGLGPGGGLTVPSPDFCWEGGGSFGSSGDGAAGPTYGTPSLLPLIGGSGGAGGNCVPCRIGSQDRGGGGGGGGGAILIASNTTIIINGTITAKGGGGASPPPPPSTGCFAKGGSSGAIRLIANAITGNGTVSAPRFDASRAGGAGRIRFESIAAIPATLLQRVNPEPSVFIFQPFAPPAIVMPGLPSLRITTIDGVDVPYPPRGQFGSTDVVTTNPGTKIVALMASGIPLGTTVQVSVKPEIATVAPTTFTSTTLTGTLESSTAMATINLPALAIYYVEARATFTAPSGAVEASMKIHGHAVKQIRVETAQGAGSKVTYILESGQEVPAENAGWAVNTARRSTTNQNANTWRR